MEIGFIISTLINLSINLFYTILALLISVLALKFVDQQLLRNIDLEKEIKSGNMAAAVFASTILIFVAIIVSFGLKG